MQSFTNIASCLETAIFPRCSVFLRWYNRLKKPVPDRNDRNRVKVRCHECREEASLNLENDLDSRNGTCPICLEERSCVVLPCHQHHQICRECLQMADRRETSIRELAMGRPVPAYVHDFASRESESIGTGRFTLYEDRNYKIWIMVFRRNGTDFYCFDTTNNSYFVNTIKKLSRKYGYAISSQGYLLVWMIPRDFVPFLRLNGDNGCDSRYTGCHLITSSEVGRIAEHMLAQGQSGVPSIGERHVPVMMA